jgi:hypothetical protein
MRFRVILGALLAALFLAVVPACALTVGSHGAWTFTVGSLLGLAGVVTVTYGWPVQGTTAPTATQASQCSMQTAKVYMADADLVAPFTHNWGASDGALVASFPTYLFPIVIARLDVQGAAAAISFQAALTFDIVSSTNVVSIYKSAGCGGTFVVTLLRPAALIR